MVMNTQIKLVVRPNNQIVLTTGKWKKKEIQVTQNPQKDFDRISYLRVRDLADDYEAARVVLPKIRGTLQNGAPRPLDLIKKSQRSRQPLVLRRNTPKNFTRFSGQKVRECGAAMAIASGGEHSRCREITLTLPANHHDAFQVLADASSYTINRLLEPIRKQFGKKALWFFVWEYQKRGALHLHFAIYHEDIQECERMALRMIEQWHKILCDLSAISGVCMFSRKNKKSCTIRRNHQYHTAPMKKEVSRYFAKYAGKEESKNSWYCQKYPVSRFWGCSYSLKEIIKKNSFEYQWDYFASQESAEQMVNEIIESIIEKINLVSFSSYEFAIWLQGKCRINKYQNGRKILSKDADRCICNGFRQCFYCDPKDLQLVLANANCLSQEF
jgi:hypothetical protein